MKEGKKRFNKIVSLVLAAVMMVSIFAVTTPQEVEAASTPQFKKTGSSKVTIKDSQCYRVTGKANYIKFKAGATGYITVKITGNSSMTSQPSGYLTLCNNKKKTLGTKQELFVTGDSKSWAYTRTYGIQKGKVYYFKVESYGGVKLNATVKAVKKNAATSRAKAKNLSKNKAVNGVLIAGDKKADWYKIKVTKSQKVKISWSAKTNGVTKSGNGNASGIKMTFYKSNGKMFTNNAYDYVSPAYSSTWIQFYRKYTYSSQKLGLEPGTYYIKIEPYTKTSSGYYTLKWK